MCLTETWFQDDDNYQTAFLSDMGNYTVFNKPRITDTIGGGVCILIKNIYKAIRLKKSSYSAFESTTILCCFSNMPSQKLKVVSLYRRESTVFSTFLDEFCNFVQDLILSKYSFIIGGDLNVQMNNAHHSYTKRFRKICKELNLNLANVPSSKTHIAGNTLDFIVSDVHVASMVESCIVDVDAPSNISHHFPVIYSMKSSLQCRTLANKGPRRNFRNFSLSAMKEDLSESLSILPESCDSFETKVATFQEKPAML